MPVARKMPSDLGGNLKKIGREGVAKKSAPKKAAVKKTSVKKVSGLKYAATKKPNRESYPFGEYAGYPGQSKAQVAKGVKKAVKKSATIKKNAAANRVRDTKPAVRSVRRRAL